MGMRALLDQADRASNGRPRAGQQEVGSTLIDGYLVALRDQGGRTGLLVARRPAPS